MKTIDLILIITGIVLLVLIGTMFVPIEHTIQKTQIIKKTHPLHPIAYQAKYLHIRPINGFTREYLRRYGAGYGMAFHCDLTFVQK
jgi:hypothetical protein